MIRFPFSSVPGVIALSIIGTVLLPLPQAWGQIIADDTLRDDSVVQSSGGGFTITGGTQEGTYLFHSFREFSVPTNGTAIFLNPDNISIIFSRVTGNSISAIDGFLGNRGSADLFLINPNGILFGENARLNIQGSFIASSASSVVFADGVEFRADEPGQNSLLTVSVPMGLQFGASPGRIQNQGSIALGVPAGKTLGLVGNGLTFLGGSVFASDGRIELGSVSANQFVGLSPLNPGWRLAYGDVAAFADIGLENAASIDAQGLRGGDIQVYGQNLTIRDGSQILTVGSTGGTVGNIDIFIEETVDVSGVDSNNAVSGIFLEVLGQSSGEGRHLLIDTGRLIIRDQGTVSTNTLGLSRGADLDIRASESVVLQGTANAPLFSTGLFAQAEQQGKGGIITVTTPQLVIEDGARISTTTFSSGNAGSIDIRADQILLQGLGRSPNGQSIISAIAATTENSVSGNGGTIAITTDRLTLLDGAQIITSTRGTGDGGELRIDATDSITLRGAAPDATANIRRSGLFVASERQGTGDVGNLVVRSPLLRLEDRAEISANTFRGGTSGRIDIAVETLIADGGGQIRANSFRNGRGGEVVITASDRIQLSGTGTLQNRVFASGIASRVPRQRATADAGAITILGDRLDVTNGAEISVNSVGTGEAGDLRIEANELRLNQGTLSASTRAGGGALIDLQIRDILLLSQGSNITARAFDNGDGGNITINAPTGFIAALPDQDSNIIAQANQGRGGNIDVTAQSIFDLQERPEVPITNDIDASSQFGLDGNVTITRFETDPSRGAIALPTGLVDVSRLIAQDCSAGGAIARQQRGEFVVTGQGGISPIPGDVLSQALWDDWRGTDANTDTAASPIIPPHQGTESPPSAVPAPHSPSSVVEAQSWVYREDGTVQLLTNASMHSLSDASTGNTQWLPSAQCQRS